MPLATEREMNRNHFVTSQIQEHFDLDLIIENFMESANRSIGRALVATTVASAMCSGCFDSDIDAVEFIVNAVKAPAPRSEQ